MSHALDSFNTAFLIGSGPHFHSKLTKWRFTERVYRGYEIEGLLTQREQREPKEAFKERKQISTYTNYFAHCIDAHAGVLLQEPPEIDWGNLGDPENPSDLAYRIKRDIDGTGTTLFAHLRKAANELMLKGEVGGLVDGITENGVAPAYVIPPQDIVNWNSNETEFKIRRDEPHQMDREVEVEIDRDYYTAWSPEGFEHYQIDNEEEELLPFPEDEQGFTEFENGFETVHGKPIPPFFRVELPVLRQISYNLANNAISIYEMESVRDMGLRSTGFGYLVIYAEDNVFDDVVEDIKNNNIVIQGDPDSNRSHQFVQPNFEAAEMMDDVVHRKIRQFYTTAFKEFQRAGRMNQTGTKTAANTEENISAFLSTVAFSLEEYARNLLRLLEQQHYPNKDPKSDVTMKRKFSSPEMTLTQKVERNDESQQTQSINNEQD